MKRKLAAILLMIAVGMLFTLSANASLFGKNPNLIKNGGFEDVRDNFPKDWRIKDQPLPEGVTVEISQENPHSGKNCLLFNHGAPSDTMVIQNLKVKQEKVYMITCWLRTENVAQQAGSANLTLLYLEATGGIEGILTSQEFSDTGNQWYKLEFPFRARKTSTPLIFGLRFGGQGVANQGKVYFDDLEVVEIPNRDDAIGFYIPSEAGSEPPPTPPVPSKTLIFIIIGTLVVGFLVFLEFNLSQKEKKEQEKAEAEKTESKQEMAQTEPVVNGQISDKVAEKSADSVVNDQVTD